MNICFVIFQNQSWSHLFFFFERLTFLQFESFESCVNQFLPLIMSSESDINCTPPELRQQAENVYNLLLPGKSKSKYMNIYSTIQHNPIILQCHQHYLIPV